MKFEEFDITPEIKKSLEELGFKKPTDIQFKSIPAILKGDPDATAMQRPTCCDCVWNDGATWAAGWFMMRRPETA